MSQPKKPASRRPTDPDLPRRKAQLETAERAMKITDERANTAKKFRDRQITILDSVVQGLQAEVDKLLKKSPVDEVSDLMLEQVNQVIIDTRGLLAHDDYVKRQADFVPAGENPEVRDVSLALTQLRQGLHRFKTGGKTEVEKAEEAIVREAETIVALCMYVEDRRKQIKVADLRDNVSGVSQKWLNGRGMFDFEKLDDTDLAEYFKLES